jgi:hypothetical protein
VSLSNGFEDRYAAAPTSLPHWTDRGSVAVAVEKITGIGAVAVRLNERAWILPALVAPYAGTMTAVHAWYPGPLRRQGWFRMGNYSLLGFVGGNFIADHTHGFLACTEQRARSAGFRFTALTQ